MQQQHFVLISNESIENNNIQAFYYSWRYFKQSHVSMEIAVQVHLAIFSITLVKVCISSPNTSFSIEIFKYFLSSVVVIEHIFSSMFLNIIIMNWCWWLKKLESRMTIDIHVFIKNNLWMCSPNQYTPFFQGLLTPDGIGLF